MKKIKNVEISVIDSNNNNKQKFSLPTKYILSHIKNLFFIFILLIVNDFIVYKIIILSNMKLKQELNINNSDKILNNTFINTTNIDFNDEFFKLNEVKLKIKEKNLKRVDTIAGGYGHIGNALIMLNNLIAICINIKCKNIISPGGLQIIIKKPIFCKDYNITIFPNKFKNIPKIDILLSKRITFNFNYKSKRHENRLKLIRDEVINNIPKYHAEPNDLYINIRSGDIFINKINNMYSQPPLCFYQKIINENKFNKIYILSNGHENPVVDRLIKLYPKIQYIHGKIEYDISVIINAYNFVLATSTFPFTLIHLNYNLKNLYIYELLKINYVNASYIVHKMIPSIKYRQIMEKKWKNTKEQLDLMLNEDCINSKMETIF